VSSDGAKPGSRQNSLTLLVGGYIAADPVIGDAIRSAAPSLIFATAIPPAVAAAASNCAERHRAASH
jgi:5-aminolevulinate synthase